MRWLLLLLLFAAPLMGEIRVSDDLEAILDEAQTDTLVVLDIWETLMLPSQWLGGPRSQEELSRSFEKRGVSTEEAERLTSELMARVQRATGVTLVDQNGALFVQNLQNRGVHVIGQTCDPPSRGYLTADQLSLLMIDLKRTALPQHDVELDEGIYMEGILFVFDKEQKGSSLISLLEVMREHPRRVLFVDNEEEHVKDVHQALEAYEGIEEVDAVVYTGAEGWERGYRQEVVDLQARQLGRILTDDQAQKLIDAEIEQ